MSSGLVCPPRENRTDEIPQGFEPSTDNRTNTMAEATHRVNSTSAGLPNLIEQHKTRVSELSIIDVNDPLPSKCAHSVLDYNAEGKNSEHKLQETKQQYRQEAVGWPQQQGKNSGTKGRHNEAAGTTRKQTHGGHDRDNSHEKAGPSQYYDKRRREHVSSSVGHRHFVGKPQQDTTLN